MNSIKAFGIYLILGVFRSLVLRSSSFSNCPTLMEPSKIFGGTEECHSSESGWTMYIGGDDGDDNDDGRSEADDDDDYAAENGGHADETEANHEADSDDSMASDASSGPSHQGQFYGNMEGGHGTTYFKHDEDEEERDYYLDKKAKKSMEKQKLGLMKKKEDKEVKEQMTLKSKGATTDPSRSGSKVRQSIWLGKRNKN